MVDGITVGQLVTFIMACSALYLAIKNLTKPFVDFSKKVNDLEQRVTSLEKTKAQDYDRLSSYDKDIHLMLKVCYNLLEHEVTGNHTQDMTNTLNELRTYMLEK